jgi:hypothetical protein
MQSHLGSRASLFVLPALALAALAGCVGEVGSDHEDNGAFQSQSTPVVQTVNEARLYMSHYAEFEEPDEGIPPGLYIDAATGAPTNELFIAAPLYKRTFTSGAGGTLSAPAAATGFLPYLIDPPNFVGLPAPPEVVGAISGITGVPADVVAANTQLMLVAIGQFLGDAPAIATYHGESFSVQTTMHFQVRLRMVFRFSPPPGVPAPPVGIIVGFMTRGMLGQLVPSLPPPADPSEIVSYDWSAKMNLSTANSYLRPFASEPPPVAEAFESDETAVSFTGSPVDAAGHYTIVGSAAAKDVTFTAPPELLLVLFHAPSLTDVEFAVEESGTLAPAPH